MKNAGIKTDGVFCFIVVSLTMHSIAEILQYGITGQLIIVKDAHYKVLFRESIWPAYIACFRIEI